MKYLFIYGLMVLAFCSCTKEQIQKTTSGSKDTGITKSTGVINLKLFELINMNYPGLEKAKSLHESGQYYKAAKAILAYYQTRTDVINPNISLLNVVASEDDKLKADYALDNYRFFVNNYYENVPKKMPYSLNNGGKINWSFEPAGADNEYRAQLNRHQWFVPQARVYRTTKNERYMQSWMNVYTDWLQYNPIPDNVPNNTTSPWSQLQVAERLLGQTELFDYYKNSINFTPEWFSEFMVHFAEHADFLAKYPYAEGNILVSQGRALTFGGVLFPEFAESSNWMKTGFGILAAEVQKQFLVDGMHYELDLSYHIGVIANFYEFMKLAEANKQIVGNAAASFSQYLHKAAQIVMHFTYPSYFGGTSGIYPYLVPGFNDTRQSSWTRNVLNRNFNSYTEMFPEDNELLYMATYGKRGKVPAIAPQEFTASGYYMLRNGWDKSSTVMILSNNYTAGTIPIWSHNQPDNGTFELYHKGRNFFPDAGVYAYMSDGDNSARAWYRQTGVHNTMTLNNKNSIIGQGKPLLVSSEGQLEMVAFENQTYADLKHRRYVFFVNKSFFVLVDEGIGAATGTVNLNFNLCEGDSEVTIAKNLDGAYTNFNDGNNMAIRTFGETNVETVPSNGKVSYALNIAAPRKSYAVNMPKDAGQTARYITIIYPSAQAGAVNMNAVFTQPFRETGVAVEVIVDGLKYNLNCNL